MNKNIVIMLLVIICLILTRETFQKDKLNNKVVLSPEIQSPLLESPTLIPVLDQLPPPHQPGKSNWYRLKKREWLNKEWMGMPLTQDLVLEERTAEALFYISPQDSRNGRSIETPYGYSSEVLEDGRVTTRYYYSEEDYKDARKKERNKSGGGVITI